MGKAKFNCSLVGEVRVEVGGNQVAFMMEAPGYGPAALIHNFSDEETAEEAFEAIDDNIVYGACLAVIDEALKLKQKESVIPALSHTHH